MYLVGDIGGTKTHLPLFSEKKGPGKLIAEAKLPSADYASLDAILDAFLSKEKAQIEKASFAVAGAVVAGKARLSNLPWIIDQAGLRRRFKLSDVILMNDLTAIAAAVPSLGPDDLHTLNEGKAVEGGAIAVIAPGTGLGEAYLTWDDSGYRAHPSEGGHSDFAPSSETEEELLRFLRNRFGHVSCERVCSGQGISNIYSFLKETKRADEPKWLVEELEKTDDPTPKIIQIALSEERSCQLCIETMGTFVSILGAEAGNLALKTLATGGVYLGGGIAPRILPLLESGGFMEAFTNKGRMSSLLTGIPVRVITNPNAALLGAAYTLIGESEST